MSKPIEIDLTNQGLRTPAASGVTALAPPSGVKPQEGLEQSRSSTGARFTPPPWIVHPIMAWVVPASDLDAPICQLRMATDGKSCEEQAIPDANLIAASPELYEALSLYVAACGNTAASVDRELVQEAWRRASAALAKAQGK